MSKKLVTVLAVDGESSFELYFPHRQDTPTLNKIAQAMKRIGVDVLKQVGDALHCNMDMEKVVDKKKIGDQLFRLGFEPTDPDNTN